MDLLKQLKQIRIKQGITFEELSKNSSLPRQNYHRLESGGVKNPGIFTLAKMADFLGYELKWTLVKKAVKQDVKERDKTTEA